MIVAAEYVGGVFRPLGPVALTEGERVELDYRPEVRPSFNDVLDEIAELTSKNGPSDGSVNHDHYLYGARRRDLP